ncbi:MAG: hypothetical protein R3E32_26240 [Chitinophagales bacterium]
MKLTVLLSFVLLILPFSVNFSQTETLTNKDDASRLCDDVLMHLEKSETLPAMKLLRGKTIEEEKVLTDLIVFIETSSINYGAIQGSNLAKTQAIGEDIFRFTYALRFEKHPVWLQFYFYKVNDVYQLQKIDWGKNIEELF